jgi:hypothetical protein
MSLTPAQVEKRLFDLSGEVDQAHYSLADAENEFATADALHTIAMAKSRMKNSHPDMKMTVTMREDTALIENEDSYMRLCIAEAKVKAGRSNNQRVRTQVDITRSISSSIKASLDL